jgi:hypothetical protein
MALRALHDSSVASRALAPFALRGGLEMSGGVRVRKFERERLSNALTSFASAWTVDNCTEWRYLSTLLSTKVGAGLPASEQQ